MSESTSSSPAKPQVDTDLCRARNTTVNCSLARTARTDLHRLVLEPRLGSPGGKRPRTRKLSNPQKRLKHIDSRQNQEKDLTVSGTPHSPQRKLSWPMNVCTNRKNLSPSEAAGQADDIGAAQMRQGTTVSSGEDITDGIKMETVHGFIVDQWYDLGPSLHKDGHSPVPLGSTDIEKHETKESPGADTAEATMENDSAKDCNLKWKNNSDKIFQVLHSPCSSRDLPADHAEAVTDKREFSTHVDHIHKRNLSTTKDCANTSHGPSHSFLRPFLECPLPNAADSFDVQAKSYSLPLQTEEPYLQGKTTINLNSHEKICRSLTAPSTGIYSYATNLGPAKSDVVYTNVKFGTGGTQNGADPTGKSMNEQGNEVRQFEQMVRPMPVMSCTAGAESVVSFQSPARTSSFLTSSSCRLEGGLTYPRLIYQNSLYGNDAFHSAGLVLMPPHPYYVQQMPFVPLLSPLNYSQLQTDIFRCSYADAGSHASSAAGEETRDKTSTHTHNPYVLKMAAPSSTVSPTEANIAGSADERTTSRTCTSQQPSRLKAQTKLKDSIDFIDPTRIKFGLDDVDTDEDISRMNDCSDCSDTEWRPDKRDWKTGGWRDNGGGDGWTRKEDDHVESGSPVKKVYTRRRKRSAKEPAECNVCGKVFQGIYYLRRHQMSHSDIRPYQCDICHKSFKQKAHLIGHQSVHDRALKFLSTDMKNPSPKSKPFIIGSKCPGRPKKTYTEKDLACKKCGKAFKTVYRLKRHELSHTDVRPFSCRICGKGFKQTGHRNEHEANHEKTKRRFLCNMCGVVFRSRSSFNNHMRSHGTEKLRLQNVRNEVDSCPEGKQETGEVCHTGYDCPYCPEKFATAQALNSHLETHVEVQQRRHVQPYACDVCRRAFTYRHNLIKHKLIHKAPDKFAHFYKEKVEAHVASGKPSFKCVMCSKVFIRKETLAKHFKIHSGSKPFKCEICSRDFTQNVHLKVHMRKHTGSRPFQCKECNRSFIDSTALAKHIEYEACNTDNSLYHCKICDKLHYYLGSLKQHIRKKHNIKEAEVGAYILKTERPLRRRAVADGEKHPCRVCTSTFSEKCNLIRHIRRKHAGLVELLHKELKVTNIKSLSDEENKSDTMDKISRKYGEANNEKDNNTDKDCCKDKDNTLIKESNGSSANVSASTEISGIQSSECDAFHENNATSSSDTDGVPMYVMAGRKMSERSVRSVSVEASENHETGITNKEMIDLTNLPQMVDYAADIATSRDDGHHHLVGSTEDCERKRLLIRNDEENESADAFLEGFHSTGFAISDHDLTNSCGNNACFSKTNCCFSSSHNRCIHSDLYCFREKELMVLMNKSSKEEECSSPTNINFLYNIGLIVSSKAKVSRDSFIKDSSDNGDHDWNNEILMPSCDSLVQMEKEISSQDTQIQLNKAEMIDHICCRPESVDFLEGDCPAKRTSPTDDRSSEMDVKCNCCRDTCKDNMISCMLQDRGSRDYVKFDNTCNAKLTESHLQAAEMMMLKPDNNFQRTLKSYAMKVLTKPTDDGEPAKAIGEQNSFLPEDVCGLNACEKSAPLYQEEAMNNSTATQNSETSSLDSVRADSKTKGQLSRHEKVQEKSKKEDSSIHTTVNGPYMDMCDTSKSVVQSYTGSSSEHDHRDCYGKSDLSATTTTALSLSRAEFEPSLVTSVWVDRDREIRNSNILPLVSTRAPAPIHGSSNVSCKKKVEATTHSEEVLSNSDITWHPCKTESDSSFKSGRNNAQLTARTPLKGQCLSEQAESGVIRFGKLKPTKDIKSCTFNHQSLQYEQILKSDGCQIQSAKFRKNVTPQVSIADSTKNDYESCPTESHLKYLGLLACKDAHEIRNKSIPLEDLYETYKPWLEDLVHKVRPRRNKLTGKCNNSFMENKDTSAGTDSTAPQTHEMSPTSSYSIEHKTKLRKTTVRDNVESKTGRDIDEANGTFKETSMFKRKRKSFTRERKKSEERKTKHENLEEQLTHPLPKFASTNPRDAQESQQYRARSSTSDCQLLNDPTSSLASSTTQLQADATRSISNTTTALTVAAADTGPAGKAAASASPPTTPDSTVRGKQLFTCVVCNKYFTARHQLKRHGMTHTDLRPYNCDKCGRAFRQKVHLSDHMKRHQGQRPFVCAGCGKRFVLKNEMNQHIKNHCRGTVDVMKGGPMLDEKNTLVVPMSEFSHSSCAGDGATLPRFDSQEFMLMLGQSYKAGDIISNGTITLRVIESAGSHTADKRDSSVAPTRSGEVDAAAEASHSHDYSATNIQNSDQPSDNFIQRRMNPRE